MKELHEVQGKELDQCRHALQYPRYQPAVHGHHPAVRGEIRNLRGRMPVLVLQLEWRGLRQTRQILVLMVMQTKCHIEFMTRAHTGTDGPDTRTLGSQTGVVRDPEKIHHIEADAQREDERGPPVKTRINTVYHARVAGRLDNLVLRATLSGKTLHLGNEA